MSEAIYANSENSREGNEGHVLEVEASDQLLAITRRLPDYTFLLLFSTPSFFSNITKLEVLSMQDNFLRGEFCRELGDLCYLAFLDLQLNELSGSIPTSIFNITTMKNIGLTYKNVTTLKMK
ncbi:hypothetical protein MTR67_018154 [Solanum verrucosum]|uniref:Uncharacterized protein n=1 Tax=Solanum verrucosum TaxID=315347 RepID=A0AAF0QRM7_SOLVR|nr:hypothetical protein MTR67_018154 [Solanum verrucosum]